MDTFTQDVTRIALVGFGATALLDLAWAGLDRLGLPAPRYGLVGRWVGHIFRGRWAHAPIAKSPPIAAEQALGWSVHYAIGIGFAGLLAAACGMAWMRSPTPGPAIAFGLATAAAPLFVMQPAMGAGFASSRTPAPVKNTLRSLFNHALFGAGLYLAAAGLAALA